MGLSGFGFGEVLLIAMLVLIVFGPKRLPEITRTIGKGIREFKKGMNEIQRELEAAGRETSWEAPPPPPPGAKAADGTATIAGTTIGPSDPEASEAAETSGEAGTDPSGDEGAGDAGPESSDAVDADAADGAPVTEEQPPPVMRDHVDPADAFIDPWSTDSSRPTFSSTPAKEPVIAPPEPPVTSEESVENPAAEAPAGEDPTED